MPPFLIPLFGPIVDKVLSFIPDPAAKAKAALEAQQALQAAEQAAMQMVADQNKAQADIDAKEAASSSLFIAGWRPALGWVLSASFAWVYVLQPLTTFVLAAFGKTIVLPTLNISEMSPVLMGMLGLSSLRTYEKVQGAQGNHN